MKNQKAMHIILALALMGSLVGNIYFYQNQTKLTAQLEEEAKKSADLFTRLEAANGQIDALKVVWMDDIFKPSEATVVVVREEEEKAPAAVVESSKPESKPTAEPKPDPKPESEPEPIDAPDDEGDFPSGPPANRDTLGLGIKIEGVNEVQRGYLAMSEENQRLHLKDIMDFFGLNEAEARQFLAESLSVTESVDLSDGVMHSADGAGPPSSLWG